METFSLKNHESKCRSCFKSLNKRGKHIQITEDIEKRFYSVTQIHLKSSSNYSNQICANCDKELSDFTEFKSNLVQRQTKLYTEYPDDSFVKPESKVDILQINIKQESEDYDPGTYGDGDEAFNDNLEMLRDNMGALHEPIDESVEKPKRRKGVPSTKQRRICPDCGEFTKLT
jgi:hypothetical protein